MPLGAAVGVNAHAAAGDDPMPEGLRPHSLRRTFASLLVALGEDPACVMAQMGHTDPGLHAVSWARLGSNQRPLACEASALPLSYAPSAGAKSIRAARATGGRPDPSRR